jgi:hypothetical protein
MPIIIRINKSIQKNHHLKHHYIKYIVIGMGYKIIQDNNNIHLQMIFIRIRFLHNHLLCNK